MKKGKLGEKMTSQEAIKILRSAIKNGNKKQMIELISPDDLDILPDWYDEPDYIWEEWDELVEEAKSILGI